MIRIPSLGEIAALFLKNRTVAGATKAITDTVSRLEEVVSHHQIQNAKKATKAADLRLQAGELFIQAADHANEASKASSVATKLTALLS